MRDAILVINAGSSSIKFSLFQCGGTDKLALWCKGLIEVSGDRPHFLAADAQGAPIARHVWTSGDAVDHARCLDFLMDWLVAQPSAGPIIAAGHRVVHGGRE